LQEAVLAWLALPSAQKIRATVKVIGAVYTAQQIHRLHYGPKPADQVRATEAAE
jgi:predicted NAD/FAD-dependent oxidoreductase